MNLPNLSIHSIHQGYKKGEYTVQSLVEELYCKADHWGNPGIWIRRLSLEELDIYLRKLESKTWVQYFSGTCYYSLGYAGLFS